MWIEPETSENADLLCHNHTYTISQNKHNERNSKAWTLQIKSFAFQHSLLSVSRPDYRHKRQLHRTTVVAPNMPYSGHPENKRKINYFSRAWKTRNNSKKKSRNSLVSPKTTILIWNWEQKKHRREMHSQYVTQIITTSTTTTTTTRPVQTERIRTDRHAAINQNC